MEEGDGPTVVLLHGFPEFSYSWRKQLPALARAGFRAVAPDLRGYGQSPKPHGVKPYRIPEIADDVAALIERLGAPVHLVAHDWGAVCAWYLAMTRPEFVRKLVILNIPHPVAIVRALKRSLRQKLNLSYQLFFQLPFLPELFLRVFGRQLLKRMARFTPEDVETYLRAWRGSLTPMLNYYRAMARSRGELRPMFRPIDTPTMIIHGAREPVFIPSAFEPLPDWVPNLRIEHIPRAGHFVQTDAAERVNELLVEFLRG